MVDFTLEVDYKLEITIETKIFLVLKNLSRHGQVAKQIARETPFVACNREIQKMHIHF
jgi:hypothetical protein